MLQTQPSIKPMFLTSSATAQSTIAAVEKALESYQYDTCLKFLTPTLLDIVGPDLADIIPNQRHAIIYKQLCDAEMVLPDTEDVEFIYKLQVSIDFELLNIPYEVKTELTPLQDAIRLALYSITQPILCIITPSFAFSQAMAKQLIAAIDKCSTADLYASHGMSELFFWVLFVAAYVSRDQEEWPTLIAYIATTIEVLGIESAEQMEHLLYGFVYMRQFCGETLDTVWRDIEKRRQTDTVDFYTVS